MTRKDTNVTPLVSGPEKVVTIMLFLAVCASGTCWRAQSIYTKILAHVASNQWYKNKMYS